MVVVDDSIHPQKKRDAKIGRRQHYSHSDGDLRLLRVLDMRKKDCHVGLRVLEERDSSRSVKKRPATDIHEAPHVGGKEKQK